jgi:hypothetical protein
LKKIKLFEKESKNMSNALANLDDHGWMKWTWSTGEFEVVVIPED